MNDTKSAKTVNKITPERWDCTYCGENHDRAVACPAYAASLRPACNNLCSMYGPDLVYKADPECPRHSAKSAKNLNTSSAEFGAKIMAAQAAGFPFACVYCAGGLRAEKEVCACRSASTNRYTAIERFARMVDGWAQDEGFTASASIDSLKSRLLAELTADLAYKSEGPQAGPPGAGNQTADSPPAGAGGPHPGTETASIPSYTVHRVGGCRDCIFCQRYANVIGSYFCALAPTDGQIDDRAQKPPPGCSLPVLVETASIHAHKADGEDT